MIDQHDRKRRRLSPEHDQNSKTHSHKYQEHARQLPFDAKAISSKDLDEYRTLFTLYLDVQKKLDIKKLDRSEVKGRFKSFVKKWWSAAQVMVHIGLIICRNRGELAESWYDPSTRTSAATALEGNDQGTTAAHQATDDTDDDEYGPTLGPNHTHPQRSGPTYARLDDLQARDEQRLEDEELRQEDARYERKAERKIQKERLDELVPRADPGTRERQLEKKRDTAAANRSFRDAKEPDAEEVGDSQLMGDGGLEGYKAKLQAQQKKKSERELRKEEALRAREAERDEKMAKHRAKEAKTIEMLRAIAQERFG